MLRVGLSSRVRLACAVLVGPLGQAQLAACRWSTTPLPPDTSAVPSGGSRAASSNSAASSSAADTRGDGSTPTSSSTSRPIQTKAAASSSAAATTGTRGARIHKFSEDKGEASAYVGGADDIPSYSAVSHMGYLLLHSRRIWFPLVLYAGYYALSSYLSPLQLGIYATFSVLAQRMSVHGRRNTIQKDLTGYTCVVTGGTSGIGLYTAMQLLDMGAKVIIAAPPGKEQETAECFQQNCRVTTSSSLAPAAANGEPLEKRLTFVAMDYTDQLEVMAAAARIKGLVHDRIDLLVNCAGVWKEEPTVTKQNFEEHIGINFLGPFHLTEALLPSLRRSPHRSGRVVYVTCASHNGVSRANVVRERLTLLPGPNESQITARCYSASKLGNIFHAQSIASRRYEGIPRNRQSELHPVDVCCADPGFCFTSLQQENATPFLGNNVVARTLRSLWIKDAYEGSQTVVNCCVRDTIESGGYYAECALMPSGLSRRAHDRKSRDEVVHWAMAKTIAKYYAVRPE